MKSLSKLLLAVYLVILLWLVLLKFSVDIPAALTDNNMRLLNTIPFANYSGGNIKELIYNFLVFIPFGLLLSVNIKQAGFWRKLVTIFVFSLAVEIVQYISALGAADITDVISNTSGGLLGLLLYASGKKYIEVKALDRYIAVGGTILLISFVSFLGVLFASGVRFQSQHQPANRPPFEREHLQQD